MCSATLVFFVKGILRY